jgi:hypothetical protein
MNHVVCVAIYYQVCRIQWARIVNETRRVAIYYQVWLIEWARMSTTLAYTATLHHVRPVQGPVVLRFSGLPSCKKSRFFLSTKTFPCSNFMVRDDDRLYPRKKVSLVVAKRALSS